MTSKVFGNGNNYINDDVVYHILLNMPIPDLKNASCTCKAVYQLARTVRHIRRFEILSSASVVFLREFVEAIKTSREVANTTKCINYSQAGAFNEYCRPRTMETFEYITGFYDYLIDYVRESKSDKFPEKDVTCERIKNGGIASVRTLMVLLTLCPNVELLRYEGDILTLYKELDTKVLPFRTLKLSTNLGNRIFLKTFLSIASRPTLQRLDASCLTIDHARPGVPAMFEHGIEASNIRHIQLESCSIAPAGLALMVKHAPRLKTLRIFAEVSFWRWISRRNCVDRHRSMEASALAAMYGDIQGSKYLERDTVPYVGDLRYELGRKLDDRGLVLHCVHLSETVFMIEIVSREIFSERRHGNYDNLCEDLGEVSIKSIDTHGIIQVRRANPRPSSGFSRTMKSFWNRKGLI